MNWEMFYLTCFIVGVTLSLLAFFGGSVHFPHVHFHLPHGHVAIPHVGAGHAAGGHAATGHGPEMPYINFGTITAFLAWFGGTGYLLTRHSGLLATVIIMLSILAGLVASTIVFWFIVKFLLAHDHALDPADYEMVGVLGRVISSIREGGTGEIIFSRNGSRETCGARSDDGKGLARGTEVIVTRYERGIAYVRRYDEMAENHSVGKSANQ
jgi:membrane protein implicated in regulation of membrane protease activity